MSSYATHIHNPSPVFPIEILERICLLLPPKEAYRVAVGLRLLHVRNRLLPVVNTVRQYMNKASARGDVELLQAWLDSGATLDYSNFSMDDASLMGHVNVLRWWRASGLELRYTHKAFCFGAGGMFDNFTKDEEVMIAVLNFWRESGLPMLNEWAMFAASERGLTRVLTWWKDESGYEPLYRPDTFHTVSLKSLQWWKSSGLPLLCDRSGLQYALRHPPTNPTEYLQVLDWWKMNTLLRPTAADGDRASEVSELMVLDWLKKSGELLYTEKAMDWAGTRDALQWWLDNVEIANLKYSKSTIVQFNGRQWARRMVSRLEWWKSCGLPPKWTDEEFAVAMEEAIKEDEIGMAYRPPGWIEPEYIHNGDTDCDDDSENSEEEDSDEEDSTGSDDDDDDDDNDTDDDESDGGDGTSGDEAESDPADDDKVEDGEHD
ncbi:hypothetical protein HDU89_001557 [Geranomyces variabilis]|nr:hypothetical protein HDU89_001557 [Geranomyces variabilis]